MRVGFWRARPRLRHDRHRRLDRWGDGGRALRSSGVPGSGLTGVTGVSGTTGVGGSWGAGTSRPGIAACPGRRRAEPPDGVEIEKAIPMTYPRLRVANPENGRALVRSREPPFITDSVTSAAD